MSNDLPATEALSVVIGELRSVRQQMTALEAAATALAREVDRLRTRIHDPATEELTLEEAADLLGISARTLRGKAQAHEQGDAAGVRGFKRRGRSGGEWAFLRSDLEAYKRRRRVA
jgi:VIT1/CCC1 family predicted Fe2+/Mn2+ transporter